MTQATARQAEQPWLPTASPEPKGRLTELAEEILDRCRGEGPANCVSRCPIHVDAHGYVQLAKQGKYREALQLVREQLPFPGVLGYVCAHPCELHCKRIDDDKAIRIRDIKRFLAEWEPGEPQHNLECEPDRGEAVAVIGSGPGGLMAAHDLRRRGYHVTVFERDQEIGGCLVNRLPEWRLPRNVVSRDLSIIEALGIEVRTGVEVGTDLSLEELRQQYKAVALLPGFGGALKFLRGAGSGFSRSGRDTLGVDPVTCETAVDGVFAGGDAVSGPATVVQALAMGRRVAESIHRHLGGSDLHEGREPVLPAKILWTLDVDDAERQRRERPPLMLRPFTPAMTEEEVREESDRCLDCTCGLCVQDCNFLTAHCDSPKDIARRVLDSVPDSLKTIFSCNICTLCATVCPENLDTGEMLLEARREAVRKSVGPLPEHKPIISYFNAGVSNIFTLTRSEPGRERSKRLFFTGCALPATAPKHALSTYDALRSGYPGMGVMMICCGAPVELLGMDKEYAAVNERILREAEQTGADELVAACPDCCAALRHSLPELKVSYVWDLLAESGWEPPRLREGTRVAIHDSCKARSHPEVHRSVRTLIEAAGGVVEDIEYSKELARCCGFGGMIGPVDMELCASISKRRADESELPMITYCAGCRMALAGQGKPATHILDFIHAPDFDKKARSKPPGAIGRYANRLRTKLGFKMKAPLGRNRGGA